jgi:transmembrane sensor
MTIHEPAATDEMIAAAMLWRQRVDSGEWSVDDEVELEIWLQADERHVQAFERVADICGVFDHHVAAPELIGARRALLGRVHRESRVRWMRPAAVLRRPSRRLAAAAIAATVLAAVTAWPLVDGVDVYKTGAGERRSVILADGSVLSLDAKSRVSVHYTKGERRLTLQQGQARFDVAHNTARPFSVTAGDRTVIATGTAFNIDMLKPEVRVTLIEGKVLVLNKPRRGLLSSPPAPRPAVEMVKGQELVAGADGRAKLIKTVNLEQATAWQRGQLMFAGEPLGEAVERVNRYTETKVSVADASAAAIPISGAFNAGDVEAFVEAVCAIQPVRATRGPEGIILQSIQPPA